MNILLTGASGFLGKTIRSYLIKEGHTVITLGRRESNNIVCDLTKDTPDLRDLSIEGVVHCAGKAHVVPKSEQEKQEFFQVNVVGTQNLLETLKGIRFFCFISSVSVYGLDKGVQIKESSLLKATDSYGLSKIDAELSVIEFCKANGTVATILRLPLVVGRGASGNLGAMVKGIENGIYFNIGKGEARKSMVLATDVAKHILKACDVGGIYNLTDGYHPSFKELSYLIAYQKKVALPKNIPLVFANLLGSFGDIFGRVFPVNSGKISKMINSLTFDDSHARERFGWNPEKVLESDFLMTEE